MELKEKQANLTFFYNMCLRELETAKANLDTYSKKTTENYEYVFDYLQSAHAKEKSLIIYDNILTDLCQLSDILRKFNLKFEMNSFFGIRKDLQLNDVVDDHSDTNQISEPEEQFQRYSELPKYEQPINGQLQQVQERQTHNTGFTEPLNQFNGQLQQLQDRPTSNPVFTEPRNQLNGQLQQLQERSTHNTGFTEPRNQYNGQLQQLQERPTSNTGFKEPLNQFNGQLQRLQERQIHNTGFKEPLNQFNGQLQQFQDRPTLNTGFTEPLNHFNGQLQQLQERQTHNTGFTEPLNQYNGQLQQLQERPTPNTGFTEPRNQFNGQLQQLQERQIHNTGFTEPLNQFNGQLQQLQEPQTHNTGFTEPQQQFQQTSLQESHLNEQFKQINLEIHNKQTPHFQFQPFKINKPTQLIQSVKFKEIQDLPNRQQQALEPQRKRFTYPEPDINKFHQQYQSECIITYVKSSHNRLFYINEMGTSDYVDYIQYMEKCKTPLEYEETPDEGEVFGIYLEGYMFRAVRENGQLRENAFSVYLIDVGEVVKVEQHMKFFVLPDPYQKVKAQAILCQLETVDQNSAINLDEYLTRNLYVRQNFTVLKKLNGILYVNLHNHTNPFRTASGNDNGNRVHNNQITNPFRKYLCVNTSFENMTENGYRRSKKFIIEEHEFITSKDIAHEIEKNDVGTSCDHMSNVSSVNSNSNLRDFYEGSFDDDDESIKSEGYSSQSNVQHSELKLTQKEWEILNEEPLNTTNAMKAVLGYDPKDDKNICPFYNSKTGICFKGASCKLQHVPKIKEGWTRDQAETIIDIPCKTVFPDVGMQICLIPTYIVNVRMFFAQIVSFEKKYMPMTLKQLLFTMNAPEQVVHYKKLKRMPVRFELVLAKFKDNCWYRAKISSIVDENTFKVFYVDYGNSEILTFDHIRQWEPKFGDIPFQAITCFIGGIKEKRSNVEAVEFVKGEILNKQIKAIVLENVDHLVVKIIDDNGYELASKLVKLGLCDAQKIEAPIKKTNQLLPA